MYLYFFILHLCFYKETIYTLWNYFIFWFVYVSCTSRCWLRGRNIRHFIWRSVQRFRICRRGCHRGIISRVRRCSRIWRRRNRWRCLQQIGCLQLTPFLRFGIQIRSRKKLNRSRMNRNRIRIMGIIGIVVSVRTQTVTVTVWGRIAQIESIKQRESNILIVIP